MRLADETASPWIISWHKLITSARWQAMRGMLGLALTSMVDLVCNPFPLDFDTISDIRKIIPILPQKGYTEADISAILGENWISHLQNTLPEVL